MMADKLKHVGHLKLVARPNLWQTLFHRSHGYFTTHRLVRSPADSQFS